MLPQTAVEQAHAELWRRFVDEHNVILDYTDLDGSYRRPTPQDCREHKPSALSWGVPVIEVITHYRFDRLYLSQFFPVESAWYRLARGR